MLEAAPRGILFDLDGTLLDTAPDMAGALTALRIEEGLPPLPFSKMRSHVSHGSLGLVRVGFGDDLPEVRREALRTRFLELYTARLCEGTRLFPGMNTVLETLDHLGVCWGIVTNKPAFLTIPLLQELHLSQRSRCVISGDTLPQRKPHPAPLLRAAHLCGLAPSDCLYIGDAERDIASGRAAGMLTAVASWGYIDATDRPTEWGADLTLDEPISTIRLFISRTEIA